jgi:oligoribonuclease
MAHTQLLWLDLETTGLDPHKDSILEVGWGITDTQLAWLAEPRSYLIQQNIKWNKTKSDFPMLVNGRSVPDVVQHMHAESGLWRDLDTKHCMPLLKAEETIISVLDTQESKLDPYEPVSFVLAGSGVSHFDLNVIKAQMPRLAKRLAYYAMDIGTVDRFFRMHQYGEVRGQRRDAAHRAVDDIVYSHMQAQKYRSWIAVGPMAAGQGAP